MAKDLAIVLNNGSLNSAVITALAAQKYRVIMVYAEVLSTSASRARAAFEAQVAHFKPYREHVLNLPFVTSLSSGAASPDVRHMGLLAPQLGTLLPIVASSIPIASHYQASAIYLGLRVGPNPDDGARATEFVQILNELIQLPCGLEELEIVTPLLELEMWQVVDVGFQVAAPLDRGWSCYEELPEPCWVCRGCRNRANAFAQAAKPDPLLASSRK